MADYWKSQPKKFCTYCKCWIADNKPSVDFHERGKNHKENVANKITEIKQKSMEKAKQEAKATKEFAAMEEAAMKAYQEDLKRLGVEPVPAGPSATPSKPQEVKTKKKTEKHRAATLQARNDEWVTAYSSEGYPYYYNPVTGESRWEEPKGNKERAEDLKKTPETNLWVEAVTEDGVKYYYNAETRESRWEQPEIFVPVKDSIISDSGAPGVSEECTETETNESESTIADSTEQEAEAGENESAIAESTAQEARSVENETEFAAEPDVLKERKNEAEVQIISHSETEPEPKREQSDGAQEQIMPVLAEKQTRQPRKPTAYGTWEEIQEEEDPYENLDLELPTVAYDCPPGTELDIPQEPKVKFKEKTITSLGDAAAIGNPVFKKRKTENGKSRNIRQRISDN